MTWYYANAGQRQGPISEEEFHRLIQAGTIHGQTLVWKAGMGDWRAYAEIAPALAMPPPLVAGTGSVPLSATPPAPTAASPAAVLIPGVNTVIYGGFWIRFLARIIDGIILSFVGQMLAGFLVAMFARDGMQALTRAQSGQVDAEQLGAMIGVLAIILVTSMAVALVYDIIFLSKFGATPGKLALSLRVVRADGSSLSVGRIIGRHFAYILNGFTLCIGFIIAGFDDQKRALHDYLADTRVVKTK